MCKDALHVDFLVYYDTMKTAIQNGGWRMKIKKPKHKMFKIFEIAGITSMSILLVLDYLFDFYEKFPFVFLGILFINIIGLIVTCVMDHS